MNTDKTITMIECYKFWRLVNCRYRSDSSLHVSHTFIILHLACGNHSPHMLHQSWGSGCKSWTKAKTVALSSPGLWDWSVFLTNGLQCPAVKRLTLLQWQLKYTVFLLALSLADKFICSCSGFQVQSNAETCTVAACNVFEHSKNRKGQWDQSILNIVSHATPLLKAF